MIGVYAGLGREWFRYPAQPVTSRMTRATSSSLRPGCKGSDVSRSPSSITGLDGSFNRASLALMKTASVTESKNGLSRLLRQVRAGKSVLIFDRNVPVARLEPVSAASLPDDQRLLALERQGLIRRPIRSGSIADVLKRMQRPKLRHGSSLVDAVLAERAEDTR